MTVGLALPYVATPVQFATGMYDTITTDVGAALAAGQAVGTPVPQATITQDGTGTAVPAALVGVPTVSGTKLVQVVDGSKLAAQSGYHIFYEYSPTPGDVPGQKQTAIQPIYCAY